MIEDIRKLIASQPFEPFTIHLTDGKTVRVPTVDHVHVASLVQRVFIYYDSGDYDVIRPLHISRVTVDGQTAAPASS